ncbi:bifunctional phosphopantothenoylcysteine decarboxylase/phosphopantothenate--cysteine ligase CoaBC [Ginsengibacter hankyongi]|uniref:bifunctional phosphopantothenoylcysteine decarboxylase/phosphopantothenate--cysteine ligase CoaBC n=1 Tax=Ginsengibacter hankyongi TaxID=2607284 RepID=UPI001F258B54|nr:bifunctional phosphopantothenoylcysteine decarboxylase/phosphopantothenate--cysteine ligase CoaBC [Ginsengibacter hankyongi]
MGSAILKDKKILLCVTGSIAAYKAVILLRLLIKNGAEVKVIMTKAASDFVSPLTFSTLSKNKILSELFNDDTWTNHVILGRWADVILIAPASCNTLAKMSNGICDNLLLATYLSATCPVLIAPAMDEDMWHHPATKRNIEILKAAGNQLLPVNDGELASGLQGEGRMAEPEEIISYLENFFSSKLSLKGVRALVTAGPTYEAIDPVRYIGNRSTGTMGIALAEELAARGADVYLVVGPSDVNIPCNIKTKKITTAREMYEASLKYISNTDIIIMAAAVSDYTPEKISKEKIKKESDQLSLTLTKTKDILSTAGKLKTEHQTLVGFALETTNERDNALQKLTKKNADLIVLNSLNDEGAGFGKGTNKIIIFDKKGNEYKFDKKPKKEVAKDIINTIIHYRNV